MLLEYNYDKAMKVLKLMQDSALASLHISEHDGVCVMEYTLVGDYPDVQQVVIKRTLAASISKRLALLSLFNDFIVTKSAGKDIHLNLTFNAVNVRECEVIYSISGHPLIRREELNNVEELRRCLERYDELITNMGISNQKIPNVYRKEGSGKTKKTSPVTMSDFVLFLREALRE